MKKSLRNVLSAMIIFFLVSLNAGMVSAQDNEGITFSETVSITAEVVGIDRVDRTLKLLTEDGDVMTLEVSHAARNFDQVEMGDELNAEYYESVAIFIGDPDQKPEVTGGMVTARSELGDKPAGLIVESINVSATVSAIDTELRILTLEMPDGSLLSTKVDPANERFDTLQIGDTINATVTEAIAISVQKTSP